MAIYTVIKKHQDRLINKRKEEENV